MCQHACMTVFQRAVGKQYVEGKTHSFVRVYEIIAGFFLIITSYFGQPIFAIYKTTRVWGP